MNRRHGKKRTHSGSYWCKHREGGGRWLACILANLRRKRRDRLRGMCGTVDEAMKSSARAR